MFSRLKVWAVSGVDEPSKAAGLLALISTLVGAYYFFSYVRKLGVPFTVELSVLPSVLLVVGVVAVFLIGIFVVYILLSGMAFSDPFDINFSEFLYSRPSGVVGYGFRDAFSSLLAIFIVPFLVWFLSLLGGAVVENANFAYLIFFLPLWAFLISLAKLWWMIGDGSGDNSVFFISLAKAWLSLVFLFVFIGASVFFYSVLVTFSGLISASWELFPYFVVFVLVNVGVLYPILDVRAFDAENRRVFNKEGFDGVGGGSKGFYRSPVVVSVLSLVGFTLIPPFASYLGGASTKLLGLTSDIPRTLYSSPEVGSAWPPGIIDECEPRGCRSVPVLMKLDLGGYFYISPLESDRVYRMKRGAVVESIDTDTKGLKNDPRGRAKLTE